jgi:hypothetical protein
MISIWVWLLVVPSLSPSNKNEGTRESIKYAKAPGYSSHPCPAHKSTLDVGYYLSLGHTIIERRPQESPTSLLGVRFSEVHFTLSLSEVNNSVTMKSFAPMLTLTLHLFSATVLAVDQTANPSLVGKLKVSATQLDRLNLLSSDSQWIFDFTAQPGYTYNPGSVVNANAATFPASVGYGLTLALLNLGPCAMLPPHYHPRATNFVVAVEGTTNTYMIEENGARLVKKTLSPGKMTIFPQGSVHTMQNQGTSSRFPIRTSVLLRRSYA